MSQNPLDAGTRDAATLVILRDAPAGLEVFVTLRPRSLRFMGGATVFPGGAVSRADLDPRWESASTMDRTAATEASGESHEAALGYYVCALREAFEEVGLFLGTGAAPDPDVADDAGRFLEACLDSDAVLDTARLVFGGRWVTPLGAPVRFDTRFFCVRAPGDWEPRVNAAEVEAWSWVTPQRLLDDLATGRVLMAPPTIEMVQLLAEHATVEDVLMGIRRDPLDGAGKLISVRLSPMVHVVVAPNPGPMTGPGTNTYIVGAGPTFVIDPAVDDHPYVDEVVARAGNVEAVLVTHRHSDHVGGVRAIAERTGAPVRAFGADPAGEADVLPLDDGSVLSAGGVSLTTLHCPGHARDHLCWVMGGTASLFAGDNILGEGTAVIAPPDGDMRTYLATLERLVALDIDRIYPGHFRWLDGGKRVIRGYIDHRKDREGQVLEAVGAGIETVEQIVGRIYTEISQQLVPVAAYQVLAHLEMLEEQKKVWRENDRWKLGDVY